MIPAWLVQLVWRMVATGVAERALLALARELASRTDSKVDDEWVKVVEEVVNGKAK